MNCELAKELKNKGFPDSEDWQEEETLFEGPVFRVDGYNVPTLSELIEACGDEFYSLSVASGNQWGADGGKCLDPYEPVHEFEEMGSTPEEAVARLWLALNNKAED